MYKKGSQIIEETKKKVAPFSDLLSRPRQCEADSLEYAIGGLSLQQKLDLKKVISLQTFHGIFLEYT